MDESASPRRPNIETQHRHIPKRWIALLVLMGLPLMIAGAIGGNLTFTMRKFIDSPAIINALSSLDVLFNILVAAVCLYVSDFIWTKRGRRIPFILASWAGMALVLLFIPLANSAFGVVSLVIVWLAMSDVSATMNTLVMEIVPPAQRVWYQAWAQWVGNIFNLIMWLVINGRFDDAIRGNGFSLSGEQSIYWFGAIALAGGFLFVWFFVRERKPEVIPPFPAGGFFQGTFRTLFRENSLWPVYLLAFSHSLITTGLGSIDGLLLTEQWGYSKQDMATNVFMGGILHILLLPFVGLLLNHINRITGFVIGVVGTMAAQISYFIFVRYVLPDQRPEILHMVLFGYPVSFFMTVLGIITPPLIFDYIPRDRMGTAQAGLGIVRNITRLITLNGVGVWVVWYSGLTLGDGSYDYFSAYLFMIGMQLLGCVFLAWFIFKVRSGAIQPVGRVGFEESGS